MLPRRLIFAILRQRGVKIVEPGLGYSGVWHDGARAGSPKMTPSSPPCWRLSVHPRISAARLCLSPLAPPAKKSIPYATSPTAPAVAWAMPWRRRPCAGARAFCSSAGQLPHGAWRCRGNWCGVDRRNARCCAQAVAAGQHRMELLGQPRDKALYSEATDVWSFGVTCWEILTFARIPYEGVRLDGPNVLASLHTYLKNGSRLIRPVNCSLELLPNFTLMLGTKSDH